MATYTWPGNVVALLPSDQNLVQAHNQRAFESELNGYTQTTSLPGARWGWEMSFGRHDYATRRVLEAWLTQFSGREHRAAIYDFARPAPAGSINLSGVTASAAAQFATALTLNNCGNTKTLLAGDWFSVVTAAGSQLVMNTADATSNASGVMSVTIRHALRAAVSAGAAVTLDKPTSLYIMTDSKFVIPRSGGNDCPPFATAWQEVFS